MTEHETRSASGEAGAGATHRRSVPRDVDADQSRSADESSPDGPAEPRGSDDDRPIDVAPRTGPFQMDAAEAGMEADRHRES